MAGLFCACFQCQVPVLHLVENMEGIIVSSCREIVSRGGPLKVESIEDALVVVQLLQIRADEVTDFVLIQGEGWLAQVPQLDVQIVTTGD